ncbi:undecaprenyl-diphosphatase [Idiomarina sp. OT37-5b]|jgi:undecaprenyl-diphosphatase|uniref:Undecaprenyl-diphosphatase n=1 Tax=Idiomarina aquatica TaxID=1327752 RepID=A0AA94EEA8_9GAMM|nr:MULTISPECIES: undecaprenyl-diphosphate phosphatase [Idiomarina]AVJ56112.1 undecaprenyl-diphosphatase [Idiomarina sp. OT37-5b]RUO43365.1 undecaprenyl-diphosphatase [Idiomarina aquatica]
MDLWQAIILGIVQGITEFLPISSSAHLILMPALTGWSDQGVGFDLSVHVGTLLAVIIYFRKDVAGLLIDGLKSIPAGQSVGQSKLSWSIVVATIPACIAGVLLLDYIDSALRAVGVIITTTVVFAVLLAAADRWGRGRRQLTDIGIVDAIIVGIAQALALIPGTSRSGATITAGLFLGLDRETASKFSFYMAIPITLAAASLKLLSIWNDGISVDWLGFAIGGVASFITAITAIHLFLKWLNQFGMWPYVIYRLVLAVVLYWMFF